MSFRGSNTGARGLQLSRAGNLAQWLVQYSCLYPVMRDTPIAYGLTMGGRPDPTVAGKTIWFEGPIHNLQKAAYERALRLVRYVPSLTNAFCPLSFCLCASSVTILEIVLDFVDAIFDCEGTRNQ